VWDGGHSGPDRRAVPGPALGLGDPSRPSSPAVRAPGSRAHPRRGGTSARGGTNGGWGHEARAPRGSMETQKSNRGFWLCSRGARGTCPNTPWLTEPLPRARRARTVKSRLAMLMATYGGHLKGRARQD